MIPGIERRQPWFKFFPDSWQGDELLPMSSLAARGLLAEFLCIMHRATPYGHLLVNGKQPSDVDLARLVRASTADLRRFRKELIDRGVLSSEPDGTLYSRRMVRKARQSAIGHETGKLGGNPALTGKVNGHPLGEPLRGEDNTQIPEARSQTPKAPEVDAEEAVTVIAAALLEVYPEVYAECRTGAVYRTTRKNEERDLEYAKALARGWPNLSRLKDMLRVFLKRTDFHAKNIPGTPGQFLNMAPDCDRILREYGR